MTDDFEKFLDQQFSDRSKRETLETARIKFIDGLRDLYSDIRDWLSDIEEKGKVEIKEEVNPKINDELTRLILDFRGDLISVDPTTEEFFPTKIFSVFLTSKKSINPISYTYYYHPGEGWFNTDEEPTNEKNRLTEEMFKENLKTILKNI